MARFVLVHGAWEGGWIWRRVAERLSAAGHEVHAPTLTGLGERAHLATPEVDLDTHIADVLGVLTCEELNDVVLCGHSYGGMVITGTAYRAADRIGSLVYLDAFLPEDGQALFDLVPEARRDAFIAAAEAGEGWRVPPLTAAQWGVTDPQDQAWLDRLFVPHPIATMRQPVRRTGDWERIAKRTYVLATEYDPSPFHKFAAAVKDDPRWRSAALPCHHMLPVSMPGEVAQVLIDAA